MKLIKLLGLIFNFFDAIISICLLIVAIKIFFFDGDLLTGSFIFMAHSLYTIDRVVGRYLL